MLRGFVQVKKPVKRTWAQRWRQKQRLLRKAPHLHALVLHQVRANHHDIRCTRSPTHVRKMGCEGRKGEVVSFMAHRQSACTYMRAQTTSSSERSRYRTCAMASRPEMSSRRQEHGGAHQGAQVRQPRRPFVPSNRLYPHFFFP